MNLLEACADPKLFAPWLRDPATWAAWRAFLAALFALLPGLYGPHSAAERAFHRGLDNLRPAGGKTFMMSLIGAFLTVFRDYGPFLSPGERATIPLIAADRRQARALMRYFRALLLEVPMLARMVRSETAESFDLDNRVTIEVHTANYRSVRGYTLAAALCDETAFWPQEDSATPDEEILAALRPGLASIPGSMLLCASSPYARKGELWQAYRRWHGKDGAPVLTWQADTATMNPKISERVIATAYERDPARAAAEYGAQFRSDVETFVDMEVVEACVDTGVRERPRVEGVQYVAFVDPSGGSADSFTLAISHAAVEVAVLDCIRERKPPFSPEAVVEEFAATVKSYGLAAVTGDRYAGEWPREAFRRHGIEYHLAELPKSGLYQNLLPRLNSGRAELLDEPRLVAQIVGLERRTARGGRDSIDHGPGGHDDVANAVAGALHLCAKPKAEPVKWYVDGQWAWTDENGVAHSDLTGQQPAGELVPSPAFGFHSMRTFQ